VSRTAARKGRNIVSNRRTFDGRWMPWCSHADPTEQLAQQYDRPAMMCGSVVNAARQRMQW